MMQRMERGSLASAGGPFARKFAASRGFGAFWNGCDVDGEDLTSWIIAEYQALYGVTPTPAVIAAVSAPVGGRSPCSFATLRGRLTGNPPSAAAQNTPVAAPVKQNAGGLDPQLAVLLAQSGQPKPEVQPPWALIGVGIVALVGLAVYARRRAAAV